MMMASSFCWTSRNRRGGSTPGKFRSTCSSTISTRARSSAMDKSVFIFQVRPNSLLRYYVLGGVLMESKTALKLMASLLILAASPVLGLSQQAGFHLGVAPVDVAPARFGPPPIQAPAVAVRGTFTSAPVPLVPPPGIATTSLVPNFPTVIVPGQIVVV